MRTHDLLLLTTPLVLSGLAHAGGVDYNRRVAAVAKVAQADGSTLLHAAVQTQLFTPSSTPRDLSTEVEFRVNGVPVGGDLLVQLAPGGGTCAPASYAVCGDTTFGPAGCALEAPGASGGVCTASALATLAVPAGMIQAGDVLSAHLKPASGALPELDLSDDQTPAGDGVVDAADYAIWRSNYGATASQSSVGDSFFDVWVELELGSDNVSPVDLSTLVAVEVNGVVAATALVESFQAGVHQTTVQVPAVPCSPGDEIMVLLMPAPGALPELPGFEDDDTPLELPTLFADVDAISVSAGGQQAWTIEAGAAHGGDLYLILGSLSGTAPGIPAGAYHLPLNVDPYFQHTLLHPNTGFLVKTFGGLDATGEGHAAFLLPFGSAPSLSGLSLDHAAVLLDPVFAVPTGTTNAVPLQLF